MVTVMDSNVGSLYAMTGVANFFYPGGRICLFRIDGAQESFLRNVWVSGVANSFIIITTTATTTTTTTTTTTAAANCN
jgi:hypothetical protein